MSEPRAQNRFRFHNLLASSWVVSCLAGILLAATLGCSSGGTNAGTTIAPPVVVTAPASLTVTAGQQAQFGVTVSGTAPMTYQWNKGGTALGGGTASIYLIAAASPGDAGSYTVTVTNAAGSVTSSAATLTVNAVPTAPAIGTQPLDTTVTAGQPASFTVVASGTAPLTYQWSLGGNAITGATNATYAIAAASGADAGAYTCKVTNGTGSVTSHPATLTVNPAPVAPAITTQPAGATVTVGQPASFTVAASGTAPLTYQWNLGGNAITGATNAIYAIGATSMADAGSYTCTVTNSTGSVTSQPATLTINPAPVAPAITTQPAGTTVTVGQPASFTVAASGTAPLTYQWNLGGNAITGATNAIYAIGAASMADAGSYTCLITNAGGSITSDPAVLVVHPTVAITVQPQDATVAVPDGATFSVTATGTGLTYTWLKNGSAIGAPSANSYTVPATDLRNVADQYSVAVTDGVSTVTSDAATLTVKAPNPVYGGDPVPTLNGVMDGHIYQVLASWNLTAPADPVQGSFRVGYDSTNLNPAWSATCFFPVLADFPNTRPATYPTDTRITGAVPVQDSDYTGTGFSRGHQTGYADIAQRYGQPGGDSTMYMTNMCPQTQVLNGGTWEDLAGLLNGTSGTSFTNTYGRVWVYTGPIFADTLVQPIGPRNIPVPSAFYNIALRETAPGVPVAVALIIPHTTTIGGATQALTLDDCWKYVTTIDRVQALTGLTFFPSPASPLPAGFTSQVDIRGWGSVLENGIGKPNVHMIEPSWDSTFTLGLPLTTVKVTSGTTDTPMTFAAQATTSGTGAAATIASTTWTFGDGGTANVPNTTHTYTVPGNYSVTFTATDGAGQSNSITRVVTVGGTAVTAPTISTLSDVNTNNTNPVTRQFNVSDLLTQAGHVFVTAASSNPAVLADALVVTNTNGVCTLVLSPVAASQGASTVTVTATNDAALTTSATFTFTVGDFLDEDFETGTKGSYTTASVTCDAGSWTLANALLSAATGSDHGAGKCVRMGKYSASSATAITMNWDFPYGAKTVTVDHALYGGTTLDAASTWKLQYSTDHGTTWNDAGSTVTEASTTVATQSFTVNVNLPIRFQIIRTDTVAGRFDLDNVTVAGY